MDQFLDPRTASTLGARLSTEGQPLNRITIPNINTLIYSSGQTQIRTGLQGLIVKADIKTAALPSRNITDEEKQIGIVIESGIVGQPTPGSIPHTNTMQDVRQIPTNYAEAYAVRHLISSQRPSKNIKLYGKPELVKIAQNLQLNTSGKKDELSARILTALYSFYDIHQSRKLIL
jgi:hypothetical protein